MVGDNRHLVTAYYVHGEAVYTGTTERHRLVRKKYTVGLNDQPNRVCFVHETKHKCS